MCACIADRSIPVAWLRFKQALLEEVGAASGTQAATQATAGNGGQHTTPQQQQQQGQFLELLQLIELLAHSRYSADARYLQSAMMMAQPQLSDAERDLLSALSGGEVGVDAQAAEQQLLSVIVRLLLEDRYTPLTKEVRGSSGGGGDKMLCNLV